MIREQLFNDIWRACDIMRRDDNTKSVFKYMEQFSWLLFLKAFEKVEDDAELASKMAGRPYQRIIKGDFRWSKWARKDWPGDKLITFIHGKLLPFLRGLNTSRQKQTIASIFNGVTVVMKSPYNLKDVIAIVDEIDFNAPTDFHTISLLYERLLAEMGKESGISGEFYTPRPLVRFMVDVIDPKIGVTIYDPGCGSAGFLVESYLHMKEHEKTAKDWETLQQRTFHGQESGELPFLLGTMNMILHGVLTPDIVRKNTLEDDIRQIPEAERHDVILTNPPFGGKENPQIQQNFPIKSQATELLFLEHIMKKLKTGGRCGMVVPEGVLFRGDAFAQVKKELVENFNLFAIVSLPSGVFTPYSGVKTNLIFFERRGATQQIWYYELLPPEGQKFTKGNPVRDEHLAECKDNWLSKEESDRWWTMSVEEIVKREYDLTAKNPHRKEEFEHLPPEEIVAGVLEKQREITAILEELQQLLVEPEEAKAAEEAKKAADGSGRLAE